MADLAAVSADPISLPLFIHSDPNIIFVVDIDPEDVGKNKDVKKFHRVTHSGYEYSTPAKKDSYTPAPAPSFPYAYPDGGESWHMTGHLCIPRRCC